MDSTEVIKIDFNKHYDIVLSSLDSNISKQSSSPSVIEIRKCPSTCLAVSLLLDNEFKKNLFKNFPTLTAIKLKIAKEFFVYSYDQKSLEKFYKNKRFLISFEWQKSPHTTVILWKNKEFENFFKFTLGENFHNNVKELIVNFMIKSLKTSEVPEISQKLFPINIKNSTELKFNNLPDSFKFAIQNSDVLFQGQIVNLKDISEFEILQNLSSEEIKSILKGSLIEINSDFYKDEEFYIERDFLDENLEIKSFKDIVNDSYDLRMIFFKSTKINCLKYQLKSKYQKFWIMELNFNELNKIIKNFNQIAQKSEFFDESSQSCHSFNQISNKNELPKKSKLKRSLTFMGDNFKKIKNSVKIFGSKSSLNSKTNKLKDVEKSSNDLESTKHFFVIEDIEEILLECQNLNELEKDFFSYSFRNGQVILLIDAFGEIVKNSHQVFRDFIASVKNLTFNYQIFLTSPENSEKFKKFLNINAKIYQILPYTEDQKVQLIETILQSKNTSQEILKLFDEFLSDQKNDEILRSKIKKEAEINVDIIKDEEKFLRQKETLEVNKEYSRFSLPILYKKPPKNLRSNEKTFSIVFHSSPNSVKFSRRSQSRNEIEKFQTVGNKKSESIFTEDQEMSETVDTNQSLLKYLERPKEVVIDKSFPRSSFNDQEIFKSSEDVEKITKKSLKNQKRLKSTEVDINLSMIQEVSEANLVHENSLKNQKTSCEAQDKETSLSHSLKNREIADNCCRSSLKEQEISKASENNDQISEISKQIQELPSTSGIDKNYLRLPLKERSKSCETEKTYSKKPLEEQGKAKSLETDKISSKSSIKNLKDTDELKIDEKSLKDKEVSLKNSKTSKIFPLSLNFYNQSSPKDVKQTSIEKIFKKYNKLTINEREKLLLSKVDFQGTPIEFSSFINQHDKIFDFLSPEIIGKILNDEKVTVFDGLRKYQVIFEDLKFKKFQNDDNCEYFEYLKKLKEPEPSTSSLKNDKTFYLKDLKDEIEKSKIILFVDDSEYFNIFQNIAYNIRKEFENEFASTILHLVCYLNFKENYQKTIELNDKLYEMKIDENKNILDKLHQLLNYNDFQKEIFNEKFTKGQIVFMWDNLEVIDESSGAKNTFLELIKEIQNYSEDKSNVQWILSDTRHVKERKEFLQCNSYKILKKNILKVENYYKYFNEIYEGIRNIKTIVNSTKLLENESKTDEIDKKNLKAEEKRRKFAESNSKSNSKEKSTEKDQKFEEKILEILENLAIKEAVKLIGYEELKMLKINNLEVLNLEAKNFKNLSVFYEFLSYGDYKFDDYSFISITFNFIKVNILKNPSKSGISQDNEENRLKLKFFIKSIEKFPLLRLVIRDYLLSNEKQKVQNFFYQIIIKNLPEFLEDFHKVSDIAKLTILHCIRSERQIYEIVYTRAKHCKKDLDNFLSKSWKNLDKIEKEKILNSSISFKNSNIKIKEIENLESTRSLKDFLKALNTFQIERILQGEILNLIRIEKPSKRAKLKFTRNFVDLTEEEKEKIFDSTVIFQGSEVNFGLLVYRSEELCNSLTPEYIEKMLKGEKLKLFEPLQKPPNDYVEREFRRNDEFDIDDDFDDDDETAYNDYLKREPGMRYEDQDSNATSGIESGKTDSEASSFGNV
ncbi:hypothetical protein PVAND_014887 [Polypedilum vanderplanki]|uniref:Uncharacterized protein n=1 Tax=Polypedilum vanderplanki TaxID=319348 RepID=A0A9J6BB18_POLVA|nr:hypothetical protein PVAND_014887 [Polypedilum vanderplanki]